MYVSYLHNYNITFIEFLSDLHNYNLIFIIYVLGLHTCKTACTEADIKGGSRRQYVICYACHSDILFVFLVRSAMGCSPAEFAVSLIT
jgi:hypothetical protein